MTPFILKALFCSATSAGVDPYAAAALIRVESNWNPSAVGSVGELGYFQLRPEFFTQVGLLDPFKNMDIALAHLKHLKQKCKHTLDKTWVVCHNLGVKGGSKIQNAKAQSYYKKFRSFYELYKTQSLFEQVSCG
jgi:soluble lytic murein transglycosylase-like protein